MAFTCSSLITIALSRPRMFDGLEIIGSRIRRCHAGTLVQRMMAWLPASTTWALPNVSTTIKARIRTRFCRSHVEAISTCSWLSAGFLMPGLHALVRKITTHLYLPLFLRVYAFLSGDKLQLVGLNKGRRSGSTGLQLNRKGGCLLSNYGSCDGTE
ncbi:hypothetical protein CIPAW_05G019700 [Carya illinoinensis]|uniref:Uncharacterized protein n=1 Tax=Carya illinoinensis TaxID=32201 RepID=A0A8T1QE23_CARIL|nr:hypothetical protein CIPAW_05G019700 [Carya illinoinensis]KAG6652635.1 hypothetical protein CIPAW_05G019700 [Carya illinoinensis]